MWIPVVIILVMGAAACTGRISHLIHRALDDPAHGISTT